MTGRFYVVVKIPIDKNEFINPENSSEFKKEIQYYIGLISREVKTLSYDSEILKNCANYNFYNYIINEEIRERGTFSFSADYDVRWFESIFKTNETLLSNVFIIKPQNIKKFYPNDIKEIDIFYCTIKNESKLIPLEEIFLNNI